MSSWLISGWASLGVIALKAVLMYVTALLGLRAAHRRTLAQWTAIDVAAAVAVGAIVGRTAVAGTESLVVGIVALITILAAHGVLAYARYGRWFTHLTDHRVRVLIEHGRIRHRQLVLCGITEDDLYSELRRRGVFSLADLRYVIFEPRGELTIVHDGTPIQHADILARGLGSATQAASRREPDA